MFWKVEELGTPLWLLMCGLKLPCLIYKHVPGKLNSAADLLSRWQNTAHQLQLLRCLVPNFLWVRAYLDLLAINNEI